jgi:hypothetical protein
MMKALIFGSGVAVGFVAGARSGRQSYEKIRDQSREVWRSPAVQEKVSDATRAVKDAAPQVQDKVGALAKKATHRGPDSSSGADSDIAAAPNGAAAPAAPEPNGASPSAEGRHALDQS